MAKVQNKNRNEEAKRKAILKEQQKHPLNRFLSALDENGIPKYSVAKTIIDYYILSPDSINNGIRMCNALLHELRFHDVKSKKYLESYNSSKAITHTNNKGELMTRDECYVVYISERQARYLVVSKIRESLIENVLSHVDENHFTFDDFNDYVLETDKIVSSFGLVLFPTKIELIKPM